MVSTTKRIASLALALAMLLSTPVFAAGTEPVFYTDMMGVEESVSVTGSVMAAVNVNFSTAEANYASFSSVQEMDEEINAAVAIIDGDGPEISGYRKFPDAEEPVAIFSPEFPEIYPSDEEPPEDNKDELLGEIEEYVVGSTTSVVDSDGVSRAVKCLYVGAHCTVWGSTEDNSNIRINSTMAQQIGQVFDSNYNATVNGFGKGVDADGDGKVAIFCYDIDRDYYFGFSGGGYTGGFFRYIDMVNSSGYIGDTYYGADNYIDMGYDCIHIDTYPAMSNYINTYLDNVAGCYSTLIHEYQHLINFTYHNNALAAGGRGNRMATYMNEAFSMASEHMVMGPSETASRIEYFNDVSNGYTEGYPLTYWGGTLSNYSNSYLFGQYIRTRYAQMTGTNGNSIYKAVMELWQSYAEKLGSGESVNDLQMVAAVLGTTDRQLVLDFWAAVYLKDASGPYGFNGESWANTIAPVVYPSTSSGKTSIGAGGVKYYKLSSGSYTPSTSGPLEFIGFTASGEVEIPGAPQLSDVQVKRNSASTATVTFNSNKAGYLWYEVANTESMDLGGIENFASVVKGANTLTLNISASENEETYFWYYTQTADGSMGSLTKLKIPAYSYMILIQQIPGGTVSLTSNGRNVESGSYLPTGTVVNISVLVDDGYTLRGLYLDETRLDGNSFTVSGPHIVMADFDTAASDSFAGGSGTEADPYRIETAGQLKYFANRVNGGDSMAGEYVLLVNDIDMTAISMEVIGKSSSTPFAGTFDGGRHKISSLQLTTNGTQYVGFIGYNSGVVTDLHLDTARIESTYNGANGCVGGIVGCNTGIVSYSSVSGVMYAYGHTLGAVGCVAGDNYGTVYGCAGNIHTTVDDNDTTSGTIYAGGVVGYNRSGAVVEDCISDGRMSVYYGTSAVSKAYAGGIAGYNQGNIRGCLRTYNIDPFGGNFTYAGGIVGYVSAGTVEECYYYCPDETIIAPGKNGSGSYAYAGGIAGYVKNGATVTNSVVYGKRVNATTVGTMYDGYVVGYNGGTVTNCHYYSGMTSANGTNSLGTSASYTDLLSESYLSSDVGMDFSSRWEIGAHPTMTCPTPQALRRTQGHVITMNFGGTISYAYAYAGQSFTISAADEMHYVKSVTVDGVAIEGTTFTVTGDHSVVVELGDCVAITVVPGENGAISVPDYVIPGKRVTVTAVPADGYVLGALVVNGETVWGNSFVPTADTVVSGVFVPEGTAGAHGENLWWVVQDSDANGSYDTLHIMGEGPMAEVGSASSIPWDGHDATLTHAVVGEGITTIAASAFDNCQQLLSVELPKSLTSIGDFAFSACFSLKGVSIPEGVTAIGYSAFFRCEAMEYVDFPDSLVTIGGSAFYGSGPIKILRFGSNLTTIGSSAFGGLTALEAVILPGSLTSIETLAFIANTALTDVYYVGTEAERNEKLVIVDTNSSLLGAAWHYIASADELITIEVTESEHGTISVKDYTAGKLTAAGTEYTVSVDSTAAGYRFTGLLVNGESVSGKKFTAPKAEKVTVQGVFTKIGDHVAGGKVTAFINWALYDENGDGTGETLLIYGSGAMTNYSAASSAPWYSYRSSIQKVIVEQGITSVGAYAFQSYANLSNVTLPEYSLGSIQKYAFYGCTKLKSILIPDSVSNIYNYAFSGTGLTSVILGKGMMRIHLNAFYSCGGIQTVYYTGTASEWSQITIDYYNTDLTNASRVHSAKGHYVSAEMRGENGTAYLPGNPLIYNLKYAVNTVAREGYMFSHLIVNGERIDSSSFTVPDAESMSVSAVFNPICTVNVVQPENGTITLSSSGKAAVGSVISVTAQPAQGYEFSHLLVDGEKVEGLSFTVPDKDSVTVSAVFTSAGEALDGGSCGTGVYWALIDADGDGTGETLKIYGSGAMATYTSTASSKPWYSYKDNITKLVVSEGVTSIGACAFYMYTALSSVTLPDSLTTIGAHVFYECIALTEVSLPGKLTSIGNSAFYNCAALTEVSLPGKLTSIGNYAFYSCDELKEITIPASVTTLGTNVCAYSGLEKVYFEGGSVAIGESAFNTCSKLKEIRLGDGVTAIGTRAFYNCGSVDAVIFSKSVKSVGASAFLKTEIRDVFYLGTETDWNTISISNAYYSSHIVDAANKSLKEAPRHYVTSFKEIIPVSAEAAEHGQLSIPSYVLAGQQVTVSVAQADAGYVLDYYSVNGVKQDESSFTVPVDAESITVTAVFKKVHDVLLGGACGNTTYWMLTDADGDGTEEKLTIYGSGAMPDWTNYNSSPWASYRTQIRSVQVDSGVTGIGGYAFSEFDALTEVTLPDGLKTVGNRAFYRSDALTDITLPSGVTLVDTYAFAYCTALKTATLPDSVSVMNTGVFSGCTALQHFRVPTGVTTLADSLFYSCTKLGSITLHKAVSAVGSDVFYQCSELKHVYFLGRESEKQISVLPGAIWHYIDGESALVPVVVEASEHGSVLLPTMAVRGGSYTAAISADTQPGWVLVGLLVNGERVDGDTFTVPETGERVVVRGVFECEYDNVMAGGWSNDAVRWLVTNAGELVIYGEGAMKDYHRVNTNWSPWYDYRASITSVIIGEGITGLGRYAFSWCNALQSFTLPTFMTYVPDGMFFGCSSLKEVVLHEGVTSIGEEAFDTCKTLAHIEIPEAVQSIGAYAFSDCDALVSVELPSGISEIKTKAFYGSGLKSIVLPASVKTVADSAFDLCGLSDVYFYGTESDREAMTIGSNNTTFADASWHYLSGEGDFAALTLPDNEFGTVTVKNLAAGNRLLKGMSYTASVVSAKPGYRMTGIKVNGAAQEGFTFSVPAQGDSITLEGVFTKEYDAEIGGICGKDAYWILQSNGTLTVYGTGEIGAYGSTSAPWSQYSATIASLKITEGITKISTYNFYQHTALVNVRLPKSLATVESSAFSGCSALTEIYYAGSEEDKAGMSITTSNNGTFINAAWYYDVTDGGFAELVLEDTESLTLTVSGLVSGRLVKGKSYTVVVSAIEPGYYCGSINVNGESVEGRSFTVPLDVDSVSITGNVSKVLDADAGGKCGEDAYWALTDTDADSSMDKVTIYGSGPMNDFSGSGDAPWSSYRNQIKTLDILEGITRIGNRSFWNCQKIRNVALPDTVTSVGQNAFEYCYGLVSFYGGEGLETLESKCFQSAKPLKTVYLPSTLLAVNSSAFSSCSSLSDVYYGGSESDKASVSIATSGNSTLSSATWHYDAEPAFIRTEAADEGSLTVVNLPETAFAEQGSVWTVNVSDVRPGYKLTGISVNGNVVMGNSFTVEGRGVITVKGIFEKVMDAEIGGVCGDSVYWALMDTDTDGTAEKLVIYGSGAMKDYGTEGGSVYSTPWYNYKNQISALEVREGVSAVGMYAFYGCGALTAVELPESLTAIGNGAFCTCGILPKIEIPSGVAKLRRSTFSDCRQLSSIVLPKSVTSVDDNAFYACYKLAHVFYAGSESDRANMTIGSSNNTDFINAVWYYGVVADDVVRISAENHEHAVLGVPVVAIKGDTITVTVSSVTPGHQVTGIKVNGVLQNGWSFTASENEITVTPVVSKVMDAEIGGLCGAHVYWALTDDDGDGTAEKLVIYGNGAMKDYYCNSSDSYTPWSYRYRSQITSAEVLEGVTALGDDAFYSCAALCSVELHEGIVTIGSRAFYGCTSLTDGNLPESVTAIGEYAFYNCKALTEVRLPSGITELGQYTFSSCSALVHIELPESLEHIGMYAFASCYALTEIEIPAGVEEIESYAFYACYDLSSFVLPKSVVRIGECAFGTCYDLARVFYAGNEADRAEISIGGNNDFFTNATWYYGKTAADIVRITVENRELFEGGTTSITAKGNTVKFNISAVKPGYQLNGVKVNGVEVNGSLQSGWSFVASENEITVTPDFVKVVDAEIGGICGENAYWALTDVDADGTAENLVIYGSGKMDNWAVWPYGPWCGNYAEQITSAEVMEGITNIGRKAFYNCKALTSVTIPEGVTEMGQEAFYGCTALTSIVIPEGVTQIDALFGNCTVLNYVVLPKSVTQVERAFYNCTALEHVFYAGSESDKAGITIQTTNNGDFINALWHYGATSEDIVHLTFAESEFGTVTADYAISAKGEEFTVRVEPSFGYAFDYLLVNGEKVESLTFTVPDTDEVTVSVVYGYAKTYAKAEQLSDRLSFVLGQFEESVAYACLSFYDVNGKMIRIVRVALPEWEEVAAEVMKKDIADAVRYKVIFLSADTRILDEARTERIQ